MAIFGADKSVRYECPALPTSLYDQSQGGHGLLLLQTTLQPKLFTSAVLGSPPSCCLCGACDGSYPLYFHQNCQP